MFDLKNMENIFRLPNFNLKNLNRNLKSKRNLAVHFVGHSLATSGKPGVACYKNLSYDVGPHNIHEEILSSVRMFPPSECVQVSSSIAANSNFHIYETMQFRNEKLDCTETCNAMKQLIYQKHTTVTSSIACHRPHFLAFLICPDYVGSVCQSSHPLLVSVLLQTH